MQLHKKLLGLITLGALAFTSAQAETTMCFKENHKDFSTIEKVTLDGGACAGTKTIAQMKNEGWSVDDIKISGNNYIYILKKETTLSTVNMAELERKILERLEVRKKEEREAAKIAMQQQKSVSGQRIYTSKCANCHGQKGEVPYATSRAINELNLDDFLTTMRDYGLGEYDRGQAFVMAPYATTKNDAKNVYIYLQSLKPANKENHTEEKK